MFAVAVIVSIPFCLESVAGSMAKFFKIFLVVFNCLFEEFIEVWFLSFQRL